MITEYGMQQIIKLVSTTPRPTLNWYVGLLWYGSDASYPELHTDPPFIPTNNPNYATNIATRVSATGATYELKPTGLNGSANNDYGIQDENGNNITERIQFINTIDDFDHTTRYFIANYTNAAVFSIQTPVNKKIPICGAFITDTQSYSTADADTKIIAIELFETVTEKTNADTIEIKYLVTADYT